jgi:hypothetical protein
LKGEFHKRIDNSIKVVTVIVGVGFLLIEIKEGWADPFGIDYHIDLEVLGMFLGWSGGVF